MADIQPPPTYEMPVQIDEDTKKARFSANWLKWFIDLTGILNAAGGTTLEHNALNGLQGGAANDYYHLTQTQHGAIVGVKSANTFYAGPTTGVAANPAFRALVTADLPAGTGTVTSVAVSGSNGIGVSGSPVTSAGTITLTLGDITPDSVVTGAITSSALTSGRVPVAGTSGLLGDFSELTFNNTFGADLKVTSSVVTTLLVENSANAGASQNAVVKIDQNNSAGNPYVWFNGTTAWFIGVANSSSGRLHIGKGAPSGGAISMYITTNDSVVISTGSALSTSATDGFLYIPTCAGTPTGAPTAQTGASPMVIDSTNHKLYFYSGGAWRDAGP